MRTARFGSIAAVGAVATAAFVGGRLTAHSRAGEALARPASAQPADAMPPAFALSPMHEHLKHFVGDWDGAVRFRMGRGEEWVESKGTARREMILDGRFVIEHVDAEGMGEGRFQGLGIVGFNTIDNRFESVWIENMATYVSTSSGTYDERAKSFTFEGEMIDPMTGNRVRTRMTMDCSEPDREVATGWTVLPDGTLEKTFEGVFERKH